MLGRLPSGLLRHPAFVSDWVGPMAAATWPPPGACSPGLPSVPEGDGWWSLVSIWEPTQTANRGPLSGDAAPIGRDPEGPVTYKPYQARSTKTGLGGSGCTGAGPSDVSRSL
jgi:hypothetical protein